MNQTGATDLEKSNPRIKRIPDPYGGKDVIVVPALNPDVAIVHVQRADENGNAHLWGIIGEQNGSCLCREEGHPTAEEIVDESVIRSDPNRTMIPANIVDAVCHVPYASHPSYSQGHYDRDNEFYLAWDRISESKESVKAYLDEWVFGVKDREEYWQKLDPKVHTRAHGPRNPRQVRAGLERPNLGRRSGRCSLRLGSHLRVRHRRGLQASRSTDPRTHRGDCARIDQERASSSRSP